MDFLDFVSGAFGGITSFLRDVVQFLIALVNIIIRVLLVIVQALQVIFGYVLKALRAVGSFLKHVWDVGIKGVLSKLVSWVRTAQQWIEGKLKPLIQFLTRVRQYLDRIYKLYIRPYLIFLQRIRRWLALLRLLHIKWAEQLDNKILRTERLLAGNFLRIRAVLNDVIGFVNALAHPTRLSRLVAASIFGRRSAAAIVRAITGLPIGFFFPNSGKGALPFEQPVTRSSQIKSPITNPGTASLLGGLFELPDTGFTETDPTPTDAELAAIETVPYFDGFLSSMEASEIFFDAAPDLHLSIREAIEQGTNPLAVAAAALTKKVS